MFPILSILSHFPLMLSAPSQYPKKNRLLLANCFKTIQTCKTHEILGCGGQIQMRETLHSSIKIKFRSLLRIRIDQAEAVNQLWYHHTVHCSDAMKTLQKDYYMARIFWGSATKKPLINFLFWEDKSSHFQLFESYTLSH